MRLHKGAGLVSHAYTEETIEKMKGYIGIGHNRYSTSGPSVLDHAQPVGYGMTKEDISDHLFSFNDTMSFSLAHNGNLPSVKALEEFLKQNNVFKNDRTDSELIADAVGFYLEKGETLLEAVKKVYPLLTGAFAIVMMSKDTLVAIRDSHGMRPLSLGKINDGHIVASETCALKTLGAEFVRYVEPGEMIVINENGVESIKLAVATPHYDTFEFVYFARPDSVLEGKSVYEVRKKMGTILAREFVPDVDMIVPVPDTAFPVAIGYSKATGIPLEMALVKNRYVHRTFIEPTQKSRENSVALKLVPMPEVIEGKKIALIDDSIVRGTTSKRLVQNLFKAGAKEVHFLVSSPPVKFPDFYGIDTPKQENLIAATKSIKEICEFLGATSLHYLSIDGLVEAIGIPKENLSLSFFNGIYPIDIKERKSEVSYEVPKE